MNNFIPFIETTYIRTIDLILPYTDVCTALYVQCFPSVCEKNFTGDSGGIRTHNLLLTSADVLTSRPPSLPDDYRPARILCSSRFHDIYRLMQFLHRVIATDLILAYTDVCTALCTQCFPSVCEKNFTGDSGGIRTHDLLLTSADVLTSRPPSLPNDCRPARILCSSGFCDIYRLMQFLHRVINNWFNFGLHWRVYSTVYSVLSECLWENLHRRLGRDSNPRPPAY